MNSKVIIAISLGFGLGTFQTWNQIQNTHNPNVEQNFNSEKYLGTWYEFMRDKNTPFQKGDNTTANYSIDQEDKGIIVVLNKEYREQSKEWKSAKGTARIKDITKNEGSLQVRFSKWAPWGDYRVVYTDYHNISIVYSQGTILGIKGYQYLWVLTRKPFRKDSKEHKEIYDQIIDHIRRELPFYELDRLRVTDQSMNIDSI